MEFLLNSPSSKLLPFAEKCGESFGRFSPLQLREKRRPGEEVNRLVAEQRVLARLNLSATKLKRTLFQDQETSLFSSPRRLTEMMKEEEVKIKIEDCDEMKTTKREEFVNLLQNMSSPKNLKRGMKRKQTNLLNEDRVDYEAVDITVDLCGDIIHGTTDVEPVDNFGSKEEADCGTTDADDQLSLNARRLRRKLMYN